MRTHLDHTIQHKMILCTVLKRSADFDFDYVAEISSQIRNLRVPIDLICVCDEPSGAPQFDGVTYIPMAYDLPGWWSKMNLFFQFDSGFVFIDLDTIFTGDPSWLWRLTPNESYLLSDFEEPDLVQSGIMVVREDCAKFVSCDILMRGMKSIMRDFRGDGEYLHSLLSGRVSRLQDAMPGQIASYSMDVVRLADTADNASIICFHGRPRPRDVDWSLELVTRDAAEDFCDHLSQSWG